MRRASFSSVKNAGGRVSLRNHSPQYTGAGGGAGTVEVLGKTFSNLEEGGPWM